MASFVRYLQIQGYVVDSVDRAFFFTVRAHTILPLPRQPLPLQVSAYFGGPTGVVELRATYEHVLPLRVRAFGARQLPAQLPAPARKRQVRYSTLLAPARRAAFLELQRLGREAFPGALLTYANQAF